MALFRDVALSIFDDMDIAFDIEINRKAGEATFDQDSSSPTFGQLIEPEDLILTRRVSITPYSTNDLKDGMIAKFLEQGYKIHNLAYMASSEEVIIGDTLMYLGLVYEVMESLPITAGNGLGNTYEIVYYDCLIAKKENQDV